MFESLLYGTVNIHWAVLALLCAGCSCVGFVGLGLMIAAKRGGDVGPPIEEINPGIRQ